MNQIYMFNYHLDARGLLPCLNEERAKLLTDLSPFERYITRQNIKTLEKALIEKRMNRRATRLLKQKKADAKRAKLLEQIREITNGEINFKTINEPHFCGSCVNC